MPLRGYEDMRLELNKLMEKYENIKDIIKDPDLFINFNTELDYFIREYRKLYRQEHDAFQQQLKLFYQSSIIYQNIRAW